MELAAHDSGRQIIDYDVKIGMFRLQPRYQTRDKYREKYKKLNLFLLLFTIGISQWVHLNIIRKVSTVNIKPRDSPEGKTKDPPKGEAAESEAVGMERWASKSRADDMGR